MQLSSISLSLNASMTSLAQLVKSLFRKYDAGTNGHMYIGGAGGVVTNGFQPGNYVESAGTTLASVDGPVGLVLDAAGSVGSDLLNGAGSFDNTALWNKGAGWAVTGGVAVATDASTDLYSVATPFISGKTYKVSYKISNYVSGSVRLWCSGNFGPTRSANGTYSEITVANTNLYIGALGASFYGHLDDLVVQEITGIHASQATAGYKPMLRKGIVNLLLNSNAPATQTLTLAIGTYTLSLIGTGSVVITGMGSGTLTGTGAGDHVTLTFSVAVAGSVVFTKAGSVTQFGLFQGTLTAAQILAYGGIPLTGSAAASSSLGPQYLAFDGVDDRLTFPSNHFTLADDFVLVIAARTDDLSGTRVLYGASAVGNPKFHVATFSTGRLYVEFQDNAGTYTNCFAAISANTDFVVTVRKTANTKVFRLNGADMMTSSVVIGAATLDLPAIGCLSAAQLGSFAKGRIYDVIPIKGALTDAEVTLLENQAAKAAGGRIVAGAFVSDF